MNLPICDSQVSFICSKLYCVSFWPLSVSLWSLRSHCLRMIESKWHTSVYRYPRGDVQEIGYVCRYSDLERNLGSNMGWRVITVLRLRPRESHRKVYTVREEPPGKPGGARTFWKERARGGAHEGEAGGKQKPIGWHGSQGRGAGRDDGCCRGHVRYILKYVLCI